MSCHAASNLEAALPGYQPVDSGSPAASRGTDIHAVLAAALVVGTNADLKDIIKMLQYVADLRDSRRFNMLVEHKMWMSWMQDPSQTTADVVLYLMDEIHIIDHKAGSIVVDPDAPQLITYAAAALSEGLAPKAEGVWLHVNQPRANNQVKTWISRKEVERFIQEQKRHEEEMAAGDLSFGPSYKACLFCPANPASRGAKGNSVFCNVAIRPARSWSSEDLTHLIQAQADHVRSGPREDDEL